MKVKRVKGKRVNGGGKARAAPSWAIPFLLGAVVIVLAVLVIANRPPAGGAVGGADAFRLQEIPQPGTHNHAPYEIAICGEKKPPLPDSMRATGMTIHTHADGIFHLEIGPGADGRRATLENFIIPAGGLLTQDSLQYPREEKVWKNGDLCPDGQPGRVKILVKGKESPFGPQTIPKGTPEAQEENRVHIEFG